MIQVSDATWHGITKALREFAADYDRCQQDDTRMDPAVLSKLRKLATQHVGAAPVDPPRPAPPRVPYDFGAPVTDALVAPMPGGDFRVRVPERPRDDWSDPAAYWRAKQRKSQLTEGR